MTSRSKLRLTPWLLAFASLAHADDAVVGTGHGASCTEAALDAGLQQVLVGVQGPGGTLSFDCGAGPTTIPISTQKFLSGQVVVDGGGRVTLDAQDLVRHFQLTVEGPDGRTEVLVRDITLARGFAAGDYGGAILARSAVRLALQGVTIRDSRAGLTGGAVGIEPGIGELQVEDSTFTQNRAEDGGAIATSVYTTVLDSRFFGNSADTNQGGAIQSWVEDLSVENSVFGFNAGRRGGTIYKRDGELVVRNSRFHDNLARLDGGAIYTEEGVERLSVVLSHFDRNLAVEAGGAILSGREMDLVSVGLDSNRARRGGAIRLLDSVFTAITNSTLSDNEAELDGGAVSATTLTPPPGNPGIFSVLQSTFADNRVTGGPGGDVHVSAGSDLLASLSQSTLMGATAASGGYSLHLASGNTLFLAANLIWTPGADGCLVEGTSTIVSAGNNLGPTAACALDAASDGGLFSFADFALGALADNGGPLRTFLPDANSPAVDWRPCDGLDSFDMRFRPRGIDADGDGAIRCDAGAVERQLTELPGSLFRDGFEREEIPGGS
jgi:predicted outer membrane repeat protein